MVQKCKMASNYLVLFKGTENWVKKSWKLSKICYYSSKKIEQSVFFNHFLGHVPMRTFGQNDDFHDFWDTYQCGCLAKIMNFHDF